MHELEMALLRQPDLRLALRGAWLDSNPGIIGGHEEGGFILRDSTGILSVERWPRGDLNNINLPNHAGCMFGSREIIASFHTHPNTGDDFLQEPSSTDIRAVENDPDLKGESYIGEIVISNERIYLIAPDGIVSDLSTTAALFEEE